MRSSCAKLLTVPCHNLSLDSRVFHISAPTTWNSLPQNVRECSSRASFPNHLKTHHFSSAFSALWHLIHMRLDSNLTTTLYKSFTYLLTYIRIEIQINPEIWIRILDHCRLRLDPSTEACALWAQSSFKIISHLIGCAAQRRHLGVGTWSEGLRASAGRARGSVSIQLRHKVAVVGLQRLAGRRRVHGAAWVQSTTHSVQHPATIRLRAWWDSLLTYLLFTVGANLFICHWSWSWSQFLSSHDLWYKLMF